jgi:nucleolar GTP-binding protein
MGKGDANPFKKMPTILTPEELMDKAHRRSEKVANELRTTLIGVTRLVKSRTIEEHKIRTMASVVSDNLLKIIDKTPSIDRLKPFYKELVEVMVGIDEFKKSLGAVKWASDLVKKLGNEYAKKARRARTPIDASRFRKEFVGRTASILKQIYPNLAFLAVAREKLKDLPTVKELPTLVIAGYPNVGKSTLLRKLTTAEPEINAYPFTTKGLNVGYIGEDIQVIDTPGVLDRPLYERNDIELQAVLALNYLANMILFVLDPSEYCGYSIEEQLNLLKEVSDLFKVPIIVAINKIDLTYEERLKEIEERLKDYRIIKISADKDIGLDELKEIVVKELLKTTN